MSMNRRRFHNIVKKIPYVESNKKSILYTGIYASSNIRVVADVQTLSFVDDVNFGGAVFGYWSSSGSVIYHMTQFHKYNYYYGSGGGEYSFYYSDIKNRHVIDYYNNRSIYIDGVQYASGLSTFSSSGEITVFARNGNNYAYSNIRLFGLKMYDSGSLVRDFIPALDSNNIPCLWDNVSKSYFYDRYNNLTIG